MQVNTQFYLALTPTQAKQILDFLLEHPAKSTLHLIDFIRNAPKANHVPAPVVAPEVKANGKTLAPKVKSKAKGTPAVVSN